MKDKSVFEHFAKRSLAHVKTPEPTDEPQATRLKLPFLVQRVGVEKYPKAYAKGVDAFFSFDYMGSAEFEFGALPKALREMRSHISEYPEKAICIKHEDRQIWYVGPENSLEVARVFFLDQSYYECMNIRLQERSNMHYAYEPRDVHEKKYAPAGWWVVDEKTLPWALFVEKSHAKEWIKRVRGT